MVSATFSNQIFPGNLTYDLSHNASRDATWVGLSAVNTDIAGKVTPPIDSGSSLYKRITTNPFIGPVMGQWFFGTLPMLLIASYQTASCKRAQEKLTSQKLGQIWAPVAAASCAIPMWSLGQTIGSKVGSKVASPLWYGSSVAAGMISAPFAGVFEGFTQWSVRYLIDVATNPVTREMWHQDPSLMGKLITKEFFLNITIGAIPGAVWQIVFFFAFAALMVALGPVGGIIVTALLVMLAVLLCNLICTHLINKASDAIDKEMGWDKQRDAVRTIAQRVLN